MSRPLLDSPAPCGLYFGGHLSLVPSSGTKAQHRGGRIGPRQGSLRVEELDVRVRQACFWGRVGLSQIVGPRIFVGECRVLWWGAETIAGPDLLRRCAYVSGTVVLVGLRGELVHEEARGVPALEALPIRRLERRHRVDTGRVALNRRDRPHVSPSPRPALSGVTNRRRRS